MAVERVIELINDELKKQLADARRCDTGGAKMDGGD